MRVTRFHWQVHEKRNGELRRKLYSKTAEPECDVNTLSLLVALLSPPVFCRHEARLIFVDSHSSKLGHGSRLLNTDGVFQRSGFLDAKYEGKGKQMRGKTIAKPLMVFGRDYATTSRDPETRDAITPFLSKSILPMAGGQSTLASCGRKEVLYP